MMSGRSLRSRDTSADFWPGFVDALATLVLVFMLLMTIFLLAKTVQDQIASTLDTSNQELKAQIAELSELLDLKRREADDLREEKAELEATLFNMETAEAARNQIGPAPASAGDGSVESQLAEQRRLTAQSQGEVELLNRQILALRRQIASLQAALDAAEEADRENKATIADMSRRINAALARKVQELSQYRSEFFSQLKDILGDRDDIRIDGDRFIFQSEVLFASGTAEVNAEGRAQLLKLSLALNRLQEDIPNSIDWILRVDGHTDSRPISSGRFPSNLHLSTARAISVVEFLQQNGVPARRLAATGFGEHHPISEGTSEDDYRRNRRIELKLTER